MRKLAILGSTGSIGTQALDVAARHSDRFAVTALVAHSSSEKLFEQVRQFHPQIAALSVEPKEIPADIRRAASGCSAKTCCWTWCARATRTTCSFRSWASSVWRR